MLHRKAVGVAFSAQGVAISREGVAKMPKGGCNSRTAAGNCIKNLRQTQKGKHPVSYGGGVFAANKKM